MQHPRRKNWPLPIATDGCRSSRIAAARLPPGTIGSERLESVGQGLILDLRRGVWPDGLAGAQLHVDGHPRWPAPAPTGRQRPCRRHGHRSPQSRRLRTGLAGARAPCEGRTRASTRCGCFGSRRPGIRARSVCRPRTTSANGELPTTPTIQARQRFRFAAHNLSDIVAAENK